MSSNPRNIKWPTDTTGFLYRFKHAAVQAVEKQHGHPDKHKAFMDTLRVIAKHAQDRYEAQHSNKQALRAALTPNNAENANDKPTDTD